MSDRRLLLVSYEFPPKGGTQSQHVAKLAVGLAKRGWDVRVLTVANVPSASIDEKLAAEVSEHVETIETWSLEPTRLVQLARRVKARGRGDRFGALPVAGSRSYTKLPRGAIRFVQGFFIPDEKRWWAPYAVAAGKRAFEERPFDVILATGPPYTAYLIALQLSKALGVPYVADLRDPIFGNYFFPPHTPVHAALLKRFERRVVEGAAAILSATPGITEQLLKRVPEVADRIVAIPNGYDPDDLPGPPPEPHEGMVISYVGTFQANMDPAYFLEAFRLLREADPDLRRDVHVRFVGPTDPRTEATLEHLGLSDVVERTGFVPHADAVRAMRGSDVLLQIIIGDEPGLLLALSSKLPEYLGARRTVLSVVPDGVAASLVRRAKAGLVVPPTGPDVIASALTELYRMWREKRLPVPDETVVEEFDREHLLDEVSQLLASISGS